ncbi:nitrilase-related carbon-nitrogen hydrolase [Curtobacterium sp. 458]|uniref:nitrilase-related carbon-nitrogen hydrolase n=1 Tax=Curtobacterium sp. 458 TaxID=3050069 RepID=UPI0025B57832|nr:nitrilase-related carbon-nitrogen hydrolase [Curtobacterium sp. 458]WJY01024.1 nitrilase-related carbon-nitrogen hydrolase [Curtobacterium sp. 458]
MDVITAADQPSPLREDTGTARRRVRVALVQTRWHEDPVEHERVLADGIASAATNGATAVFLQELTLSRYPGDVPADGVPKDGAESLEDGPTVTFAREQARRHGVFVHASLYERPADDDQPDDPRGYNTAVLVGPDGSLVGRTRKTHIPISAGYYEDTYFRPGPDDDAFPVYDPEGLGVRVGLPTCWDEWFPEVARSYGLAGAEVLAYPTAIGSEPTFPDFDTAPIWRQVIVANGITAGQFMVVPNRWGDEGAITFYGSSFISDPFGRVLVEAPRDTDAVLVADLDLDARAEWLRLFPFYVTRRPDLYAPLTDPVDRLRDGYGADEAIRASLADTATSHRADGPQTAAARA